MEKQWKLLFLIYWIYSALKNIWEGFSKEPVIKAVLKMFDITTMPVFLSFIYERGPLIIATIIVLVIYAPTLKRKIFGLKKIINQTFKNRIIFLDGKHYIDCTFENCTLRWNGGVYTLSNAIFIGLKWGQVYY